MNIKDIKEIKNCHGEVFMKEVEFDSFITKELIFKIAKIGELLYMDTLKKPFFKISIGESIIIKGTENTTTMRVVYLDETINQDIFFTNFVKDYLE